jgi:hypothetical protein
MKIVSLRTNCFFVVVVVGLLSNFVDANNDFGDMIMLGDIIPMDELIEGGTTTECLNPVIGDDQFGGICEPDCYCIPDRIPCNVCPALDNRVIAASQQGQQDSFFFNSLEVDNVDTLFTFTPTGCQPYPRVAQFLQLPICDGLIQESESSSFVDKKMGKKPKKKKKKGCEFEDEDVQVQYQCSFDYNEDKICESNKYNLVQEIARSSDNKDNNKKDKKKKKKDNSNNNNTFVTHEGTCGVCSTSQDLAINLSPTLDQDAFICAASASGAFLSQDVTQIPSVFPNLIDCFLNIGFTLDCAIIWSSNALNTLLTTLQVLTPPPPGSPPPPALPESCLKCALECVVNNIPGTNPSPDCLLPISAGTCLLTPCFSCDEDASGVVFKQYSGRTRRNSGIVTTAQNPLIPISPPPFVGTKRECSTISNIKQPSRTCGVN